MANRTKDPLEMRYGREYGFALAARRTAAKLSRRKMARSLNVTHTMVQRWEEGKAIPNLYHGQLIRALFRQGKVPA